MGSSQCEVIDYIVHKLDKKVNIIDEAKITLRAEPAVVNSSAQRLIDQIHEKYTKITGKSFGSFESDLDNYPTQKFIKQYVDGETSFYDLSVKLMERLEFCAKGQSLAKGGYVLITKMKVEEEENFMVAIVTDVLGTAITEKHEVIDSTHIDLNQLRVVGRVNLTNWLGGKEKYISFLKGKTDVSKYFKQFIGCNDVHVVSIESKKVVDLIKHVANSLPDKTSKERDAIFDLAYSYLMNLSVEKIPLSLEALANHIYPSDPDLFKDLLGADEYAIVDGFIPDGRSVKALLRYEGKSLSKNWTLKFDRVAIRNKNLRYDSKNKLITLSDVSTELHQELINLFGDEEIEDDE